MIPFQKLQLAPAKKNQIKQLLAFTGILLSSILFANQVSAQIPPTIYSPPSVLKIIENNLNSQETKEELVSSSTSFEKAIKRHPRPYFGLYKSPLQKLGIEVQNKPDINTFLPKYKGYIVQFKEKALLEKNLS